MKKYKLKFLTVLVIASLMGCGDSQENSHKNNNIDTISNQTLAKKTDMITQKITPCLWVDKDAKAVELIGSPEKLINQLSKNSEAREEVFQAITHDGPPHKQIQHTLVLKRLEALAALLKKNTGTALKFSKGQAVTSDDGTGLPVTLPTKSLEGLADRDKVLEKLSKGPRHEAIYTAVLLQLIEAMIATQEAKPTE